MGSFDQSQQNLVWGPVYFDLPPGNPDSKPTSLAKDANGNIFLTGLVTTSGVTVYRTWKLDGHTGAVLWGPITTTGGEQNALPDVSVFGNGDLLLRAVVNDRLSFWRYRGSDGAPLWGPTDFGELSPGYPVDYYTSAILSDGRVFGTALIDPDGSSAFALDGATGAPLWGPTPFTVTLPGVIYLEDMATGPDGNPVSVGSTFGELTTIKYDKETGAILWGPNVFAAADGIRGWQVQFDAAGNAFVMATAATNPGGLTLFKYAAEDGATLWGPVYLSTMDPERLAVDADGDLLVLGDSSTPETGADLALAKVSGSDGSILWGPVLFDGGDCQFGPCPDFPRALAVDANGDAYVAGDTSSPVTGITWFVLKYSGANGSVLWGPTATDIAGQPANLAPGSGRVVVTGSGAVGDSGGMTTVALNATTGDVVWGPKFLRGTQPWVDSGADVRIAANGDAVVTGTLFNIGSADMITIRYAGANGSPVWGPLLFDGGHDDYAYLLGLGFDGSGNVVVGGTSYRDEHSSDAVVLKYAGATGATLWGPVYEGGTGDDELYGFGVTGDVVAVAARSEGAMLTAVLDESFGLATPLGALPIGYCGEPYAFTLTAQNGVTPYAWSVVEGALPPGLGLSVTGILAGTPTEQGEFSFRVRVEDSGAGLAERDFTLRVVQGASPFGIQQSVNESCGYELSVYGNPASIIWLPGGETTPTITVSPAETTTYGAIVDGGNGCSYQIGTVVAGNRLQLPTCLAPSVASVDPGTAAASGGTPITVSGEKFQPGAALFIGGAAAGNVVVVDAQQITADAPALAGGAFYGVAVVNPDTGNAALPHAFFADFLDVPSSNIFHDYVVTLVRNGVTAGCGGGNYCPGNPVTRAQMAVFLLKSLNGASYVPPAAIGVFVDVPANSPFAPWIEKIHDMGITAGCGGDYYCPSSSVTRAQMAVFLLKTANGATYDPPAASGIFGDVPASDPFAAWIEQIYNEHITGGCSASPLLYCPASSVTRGQVAPFLVKTFNLQ